jgi:hypothetical protein
LADVSGHFPAMCRRIRRRRSARSNDPMGRGARGACWETLAPHIAPSSTSPLCCPQRNRQLQEVSPCCGTFSPSQTDTSPRIFVQTRPTRLAALDFENVQALGEKQVGGMRLGVTRPPTSSPLCSTEGPAAGRVFLLEHWQSGFVDELYRKRANGDAAFASSNPKCDERGKHEDCE